MKENFNFNFKEGKKLERVEKGEEGKKEEKESGEEKLEKIRMKIRELRSENLAKIDKELESGERNNAVIRHLKELEENDIDEIPEEQLSFFDEVYNLTSLSEEEYEYYAGKAQKLFLRDMPEPEDISSDRKGSFKKISKGINSLIANVLAKKVKEFKPFEKKEKTV